MIDKETHERWWPLHLKFARQEPLTNEERAFYESVLKQLDDSEVIAEGVAELARVREALAAEQIEHDRLTKRMRELDAEIASLETQLGIAPWQTTLIKG